METVGYPWGKHIPQLIRDPTQQKTAKHAPDRADTVERTLPARGKDRLTVRADVSKVGTELRDAQQASTDLVVRRHLTSQPNASDQIDIPVHHNPTRARRRT